MQTLDLHGLYHEAVQRHVENFILMNETPLKIITGHSQRMEELVIAIVERHDFHFHHERLTNHGCLIVTENFSLNSREVYRQNGL